MSYVHTCPSCGEPLDLGERFNPETDSANVPEVYQMTLDEMNAIFREYGQDAYRLMVRCFEVGFCNGFRCAKQV